MKAEIVEIIEWYNSKGELVSHTIVYERGRNCRYFEQLPKKAEKWLERAKREATWINETKKGILINEAKEGIWTRKIYRKGDYNNGQ